MAILEVKDLFFTYPDGDDIRIILDHVNASFEMGKFYTILGSSGSGKTTFLSLIGGLDTPKSGEIIFENKNIQSIGYEKYRRNNISLVFQNYNLIPYLTAVENVLVAMSITDNHLENDHKKAAYTILDDLGINETKANRRIHRLSGGEQQRVAIARALATNVDIILADEPTGNLDEGISEVIVELFQKLAHERNKCIIMVTHSKDIASKSDIAIHLNTKTMSFDSNAI